MRRKRTNMKIRKERKYPRQQIIKFSTTTPGIPEPELASHFLPKWFKEMPAHRYIPQEVSTAKRCVPLLDIMSAGYIMPLWRDLKISYEEDDGGVRFGWKGELSTLDGSPGDAVPVVEQGGAPDPNRFFDIDGLNISPKTWKLNCPWSITTPPGYSCLYTVPFNHPVTNMHVISGIVDTDMYDNVVNFPFLWTSNSWEGLIPAGTPFIQIIPFRRDSFKAEIEYSRSTESLGIKNKLTSIYEKVYRNQFWEKKVWK